jgi:hypothetical protein
VAAVLAEAVAGLPLDVDELRTNLDSEDLSGIAQGQVRPETVREFALLLVKQRPDSARRRHQCGRSGRIAGN